MDTGDYISVETILADVLQEVDDVTLRKGFTKGWYTSQIQQAAEELAVDTFFQKMTRDFDFPTDKLQMPIPEGCFNIREMYAFNGSCCRSDSSVIIHWKRLYNNGQGGGDSFTSRANFIGNTNDTDPFYVPTPNPPFYSENLYFANLQNGMIMFGSSLQGFAKVRIVYNGFAGAIGDVPIIPRFLRQAVKFYVVETFYRNMKSREPRVYRGLHTDAFQQLQIHWDKAESRVKMMNSFEVESWREYVSRMNF